MKKIIFLLAIIILISSCKNNPVKSNIDLIDDSNLSDSLKNLYQLDAYRLALRDMKENDDNYLFEYEISKELYQKYYKGIIAILNSNYTSEVNAIQIIYKIHTWRYPRFNEIVLAVEEDSVFYEKIVNNQPTGINNYDSLIEKYKFRLNHVSDYYPSGYLLVYWTDEINNLEAICNSFKNISSIEIAEPNYIGGSGDDIIAVRLEDRIEYEFQSRGGGSPSGGPILKTWKFIFYNNGEVELSNN
jgi:hypothetical protein